MSEVKRTIAVFSINWLGISETFIYRQLKALDENGFNAYILTSKLIDSHFTKTDINRLIYYKEANNISQKWNTVKRILELKGNRFAATSSQNNFWTKNLKNNRPELIHAHYGPGGLMILNTVQNLDIPLITTFHGYDASALLRNKAYVNSLNLLFKYSYIITVSEFMKKRLLSYGAPKNRIIAHYIGTDLNKFKFHSHKSLAKKTQEGEKLNFLQVSNFVDKKGHKYTIQAFNLFLKEYPNAQLTFGGDGVTKQESENLVRSLGIEEKIRFLGAINPDEVTECMQNSDLFLHHSITDETGCEEGIPTVLMEAMASGIPVVSSYHAGIPELIKDGESGFLIKEKDVSSYGKLLIKLLGINTEIIADNAASYVKRRFDIQKQNRALIDIYKVIINKNSFPINQDDD
jgi:glycosyltransferase involved in cell wall biosynthesis